MIEPGMLRAAARLGELVSDGLLTAAEVTTAIHDAVRPLRDIDRRGLACRLIWAARDTADQRDLDRDASERAVRRAVAPLMDARAPPAQIEAAAWRRVRAGTIIPQHMDAILADELRWWKRRARKAG